MTTKPATTHPCPTCDGRRIVSIMVPNIQKTNGGTYLSRLPEMVVRNYECLDCKGRGTVSCLRCLDSGEIVEMDPFGDFDGRTPCDCVAGIALIDQVETALLDAYDNVAF